LAGALLLALLPQPLRAQPSDPDRPSRWWERLEFSGDMRVRHEGSFPVAGEDRHRTRYRLRLGVRTKILPALTAAVRVASGIPANPTSANETLGDFLARDPLSIDQAYLLLQPKGPGVALAAGKFTFPVARTQMTWDNDVTWEGFYQQWSPNVGPTALRFVAVQSFLAERPGGRDAMMFAGFVEAEWKIGRHAMRLSLADYGFRQVDAVAEAQSAGTLASRNTNLLARDAAGRIVGYVSRFNLVDLLAEATIETGHPQYPVLVTLDVVKNTRAATDRDLGVWADVAYGRGIAPRTWSAGYTFARIEEDAVLSAFSFSATTTNTRMQQVSFGVGLAPRVALDVMAFRLTSLDRGAGGSNDPVRRLQVDFRVTF
jgi:hypothetical protein